MTPEQEIHEVRTRLQLLESRVQRADKRLELLEDDDALPWPRGETRRTTQYPFRKIYVNGQEGVITGSYSAATPFLWFNIANNTAEWKAADSSPCPDDTKIRDGRLTSEGEWREWR